MQSAAPRVIARAVAPAQRRFASNLLKGSKEEGNRFIAEREAVKHHAAESSCEFPFVTPRERGGVKLIEPSPNSSVA